MVNRSLSSGGSPAAAEDVRVALAEIGVKDAVAPVEVAAAVDPFA